MSDLDREWSRWRSVDHNLSEVCGLWVNTGVSGWRWASCGMFRCIGRFKFVEHIVRGTGGSERVHGCVWDVSVTMFMLRIDYVLAINMYLKVFTSLTRVTKSYLLALGTTQISSCITKHWTKFLTHQTGNYPVTCFGSKPSRIYSVELSIINTSYQKLPFLPNLFPTWYTRTYVRLGINAYYVMHPFGEWKKNAAVFKKNLSRQPNSRPCKCILSIGSNAPPHGPGCEGDDRDYFVSFSFSLFFFFFLPPFFFFLSFRPFFLCLRRLCLLCPRYIW